VGLETLYSVYARLDALQAQIIAVCFGDDKTTAAGDIQWATVAFVGVGGLIAADVLLRVIDNVLSLWEGERTESRSDTEIDPRASMDEVPGSSMQPEKRQEMEAVLVQQQNSERRRSLLFLLGANVLFWWGSLAFERTPDTPLQP
jgi:hypothetical protein